MRWLSIGSMVALALAPTAATADVVGYKVDAEGLTAARIAGLPPGQRKAWRDYLERSRLLMAKDKAQLAAERGAGPVPPMPPKGPSGGGGMPLNRDAAWYGGPEARQVAANIVSFQTPAGGWGKNQQRAAPPRLRGQSWTAQDVPWAARDIAGDANWAFVGTIDNNATTQEMRFLARVQRQFPGAEGEVYRRAFLKGLRYLLTAQYPNGGWPQAYPLMGGYHDALTFNDAAIPKVLELLDEVAERQGDYAFVPADLSARARAAAARGYRLVLATQVKIDGVRTIWGQQHDIFSLAPVGARNWEPGSLSSEESADVLISLMRVRDPSPEMVTAIEAGVQWLRDHALHDVQWTPDQPVEGRRLVSRPGAAPIWPRMYDARTGKPVYGDRDKSIHDDVHELPLDLRNSYGWFGASPAKALAAYETWEAARRR